MVVSRCRYGDRVTRTASRSNQPVGRLDRVPKWLREVLLVAIIYVGYEASRGLDPGTAAQAVHNGLRFLRWENAVHLDPERALAQALMRITPLAVLAAYLYSTMHYVITPIVLVWMYRRHRTAYPTARTCLAAATIIGLVGFALLPTAPPRLLPGGGVPDVLYDLRHWGWWGSEGSVPSGVPRGWANQFAAMPSLHLGWALWCGVLLWRYSSRNWIRWLGAAYPVVIAATVLATGNHYLLDVVGGCAAVALGFAIARLRPANWLRPRPLVASATSSPSDPSSTTEAAAPLAGAPING